MPLFMLEFLETMQVTICLRRSPRLQLPASSLPESTSGEGQASPPFAKGMGRAGCPRVLGCRGVHDHCRPAPCPGHSRPSSRTGKMPSNSGEVHTERSKTALITQTQVLRLPQWDLGTHQRATAAGVGVLPPWQLQHSDDWTAPSTNRPHYMPISHQPRGRDSSSSNRSGSGLPCDVLYLRGIIRVEFAPRASRPRGACWCWSHDALLQIQGLWLGEGLQFLLIQQVVRSGPDYTGEGAGIYVALALVPLALLWLHFPKALA